MWISSFNISIDLPLDWRRVNVIHKSNKTYHSLTTHTKTPPNSVVDSNATHQVAPLTVLQSESIWKPQLAVHFIETHSALAALLQVLVSVSAYEFRVSQPMWTVNTAQRTENSGLHAGGVGCLGSCSIVVVQYIATNLACTKLYRFLRCKFLMLIYL